MAVFWIEPGTRPSINPNPNANPNANADWDEVGASRLQHPTETRYVGILSAYHSKIDDEGAAFIEALKEAYEAVRSEKGDVFEVVFVPQNMPSPSHNPAENQGYLAMLADYKEFRATMPWLSVPLDNTEAALDLAEACGFDPEAVLSLS